MIMEDEITETDRRQPHTLEEHNGTVFEIERYAIHDGPGIRTVVFLKGCPLSCLWCANPESQGKRPVLLYNPKQCIGCKACIPQCEKNALRVGAKGIVVDRGACVGCGRCALFCSSEALTVSGIAMTAQQVADAVLSDRMFYEESGGGVTFSGGEPMGQLGFVVDIVKRLPGIHVCMETSGFASKEVVELAAQRVDNFLFDIKLMDEAQHVKYTGVSNRRILENFRMLAAMEKVTARMPVIPGINDGDENISSMIGFLKECAPGVRVDLMPYHRLGITKYQRMSAKYQLQGLMPPSQERMKGLLERFAGAGFGVSIGG